MITTTHCHLFFDTEPLLTADAQFVCGRCGGDRRKLRPTQHSFDLADGWCHVHRENCSMSPAEVAL